MTTLLSTKSLTESQRQLLAEAGLSVVEQEFIRVQLLPMPTFEWQHNLLFTSQQAVKSVVVQKAISYPENHTVFCVGEKTKTALEAVGFIVKASFESATTLANHLIDSEVNHFDFFCGNRRLDTLPTRLIQKGKNLREIVVYSTENQALKIETPIDGVLFFSPSGVESYLEKNTLETLPCFCIGSTTAAALQGITQNNHIAPTPTVEATLQLSIDYFKR